MLDQQVGGLVEQGRRIRAALGQRALAQQRSNVVTLSYRRDRFFRLKRRNEERSGSRRQDAGSRRSNSQQDDADRKDQGFDV